MNDLDEQMNYAKLGTSRKASSSYRPSYKPSDYRARVIRKKPLKSKAKLVFATAMTAFGLAGALSAALPRTEVIDRYPLSDSSSYLVLREDGNVNFVDSNGEVFKYYDNMTAEEFAHKIKWKIREDVINENANMETTIDSSIPEIIFKKDIPIQDAGKGGVLVIVLSDGTAYIDDNGIKKTELNEKSAFELAETYGFNSNKIDNGRSL